MEQLLIGKPVKTAAEQLGAPRVNERSIKGANSAEQTFVRGLLLTSRWYMKQNTTKPLLLLAALVRWRRQTPATNKNVFLRWLLADQEVPFK